MRRELHFTFPRLDLTKFGRRSIAAAMRKNLLTPD